MCFFFFNDTATTEIYTLSLHDALPISHIGSPKHPHFSVRVWQRRRPFHRVVAVQRFILEGDRKSTRLNSSHGYISYAVFCLKKKNSPPNGASPCPPQRTRKLRRPP